jgi:hypothetical protein
MTYFRGWIISVLLRIYAAITLVTVAVFSPPALSFAPILLVAWHLYLWWRPLSPVIRLLTDYFLFFSIGLLVAEQVGPFLSLAISLPMLVLISFDLNETASSLTHEDTRYLRYPTRIGIALPTTAILALGVSLLLGNISLLLTSITAIVYFGVLSVIILRQLPLKPVEETRVRQRIVAGSQGEFEIKLTARTRFGGLLFLESPYQWLKISPSTLSLKEKTLAIKVSLSPALSGPSLLRLKGRATDRWGLIQVRFELEPIQLQVIPRARYAAWLARRYLAETRPGNLPLISNIAMLRPVYGLRRGVEYYGSRLYQPGDSIKDIDWKHSLRHNEIIVKEFAEFHGQSAVILINLAVGDAEEADKVAYKIIVTALSLARENIPAVLAAYDHETVRVTTTTLDPRQLVLQSLQIAMEMVITINPVKYLGPPDVARLRANMERIRFAKSEASRVLAQLLQMEYKNLGNNARLNPATRALSSALAKGDRQSNIVVISQRNHDAEALAFNTFSFTRKGHAVISI